MRLMIPIIKQLRSYVTIINDEMQGGDSGKFRWHPVKMGAARVICFLEFIDT